MKHLFMVFLISMTSLCFGQHKLKGEIVDAKTSNSISNVEILVNGIPADVKVDKKGKFTLRAVTEKDVIMFKAVGYAVAVLNVNNATKVKVILQPLSPEDEKVSDSFGTQSMQSVTSSVTILKSEDFNKVVESDIYAYIRGKVPGLTVIRNAANPTDKPQILMRGTASLTGNYEPLIIVDGVQGVTLTSIDPNDVASITVLKDGSSQAMYGSQASGGVIIITTKKVKK